MPLLQTPPAPPLAYDNATVFARAMAGGFNASAAAAAAASPPPAAISLPQASEAGVWSSSGLAPSGVVPLELLGDADAPLTAAALARPASPVGYAFEVLFPGGPAYVRIAAGTIVTGDGSPAALNWAPLWLVVPWEFPAELPPFAAAVVAANATYFEVRAGGRQAVEATRTSTLFFPSHCLIHRPGCRWPASARPALSDLPPCLAYAQPSPRRSGLRAQKARG